MDENKIEGLLPLSILLSSLILAGAWIYTSEIPAVSNKEVKAGAKQASAFEEAVLPSDGVELPVIWGDLGAKMVSVGVIDADKFAGIYEQRGAFSDEYKNLLLGQNNGKIRITEKNAGYLLNLFWALGLGQKNPILDTGEMKDPRYGGAQNFASTGGWTIAKGGAMNHYSRHKFFELTAGQQALVDKISKGIYRPCCGNSTHFPDCNHGMAMLGLLELMASQGVNEENMWKIALAVNSYWFPDTYLTIASYMEERGVKWKYVNPEEILGAKYSSAQGFAKIAAQVTTRQKSSGSGGCGVDIGEPAAPARQPASTQRGEQGGCGI